jgi:hypothetical protein
MKTSDDTTEAWTEVKDVSRFAAEKRRELAAMRARAHAVVDEQFDAAMERFESDLQAIARDAAAGVFSVGVH